MYKAYDKSSAIRQIQKLLEKTRQTKDYIAPTGVYDARTRDAVKAFQRMNNLSVTGSVDKQTFDLLYRQSLQSNDETWQRITLGEYSERVLMINKLLIDLMNHYDRDHCIPQNGYFSYQTDNALKILADIYRVNYTGVVDAELYGLLVRDHKSLSVNE